MDRGIPDPEFQVYLVVQTFATQNLYSAIGFNDDPNRRVCEEEKPAAQIC